MTPKLQQAIRLLGLNNLELKHFIEQELVQNPLLEITDPGEISDSSELEDNYLMNVPKDDVFVRGCPRPPERFNPKRES